MPKGWKDKLHGGIADKRKPSDFDPQQLKAGISVEMEHTDDPHIAAEVAMDHLEEDPQYYKKLKKVEKESVEDEDVDVHAKNVHIDLSPHEHDDVYEAPLKGLNWKKTAKNAVNALSKRGYWDAHAVLAPKDPKKPPEAKPIRGKNAPDDDPLKTTTSSEVFETDHGLYVVFKGVNSRYYALFVDADMKKATDLDEHPGRKEAIDAVLAHHDKLAAGVGESIDPFAEAMAGLELPRLVELYEADQLDLPLGGAKHPKQDTIDALRKKMADIDAKHATKAPEKIDVKSAPLSKVAGKFLHVGQSVQDFPTPNQIQQAKKAGKPITWDSISPDVKKNAVVSASPKAGFGSTVYTVDQHGELSVKDGNWDSSD